MTTVHLKLEAHVEEDGNIHLTCPGFYGDLVYKVALGDDPEVTLMMLGVNTMPLTPFLTEPETEPESESSMAQVINKSNQLIAEVKRLRSKLN